MEDSASFNVAARSMDVTGSGVLFGVGDGGVDGGGKGGGDEFDDKVGEGDDGGDGGLKSSKSRGGVMTGGTTFVGCNAVAIDFARVSPSAAFCVIICCWRRASIA